MADIVEPGSRAADDEENIHAPSDGEKTRSIPHIKFKDAVGRRFMFPFHLVKTWAGMESLIRSAFEHVDILEQLVTAGRYDLIGASGEVILPQVWEYVIQPGWFITMHMWRLPDPPSYPPPGMNRTSRPPPAAPERKAENEPRRQKYEEERYTGVQAPLRNLEPSIFHLPENPDSPVGEQRLLSLILFPFVTNGDPQTKSAEIVVSCKLRLPPLDGMTALEVGAAAFFGPSPSGGGLEQLPSQRSDSVNGGGSELEVSTTSAMEGGKEYVLAVLAWRQRGELAAALWATFHVRTAQDREHIGRTPPVSVVLQPRGPDSAEPQKPWTPFSWALTYDWQDALDLLVRQPEVLENRRDGQGRSAISWAGGTGNEPTTKLLMEQPDIELDEEDKGGRTPLSWAAGNGHAGCVEMLLSSDKAVNSDFPDENGRTPISWASGNGHAGTVEAFLASSKRVDPDFPDKDGRAPLSWAAGNGHAETVQVLIRYVRRSDGGFGESSTVGEILEHSPISWAAKSERENVLRILLGEHLKRGARPPLSAYLHKAAVRGWSNLTALLIEKSPIVDPPDRDNDDRTPLCVAAQFGRVEVVRLLLQANACCNYRTSRARETPLSFAIRHRHEAVVRALLDAGADIALANAKGETPMSLAQRLGHAMIFNIMLAATDKEGRLAEAESPHLVPDTDCHFQATVIDFVERSGVLEAKAVEVNVRSLLQGPAFTDTAGEARPAIRWLHLPANNMRWVELLMMRLCRSPAEAYKVLDAQRWLKRQHHGATGVHHGRFMRPLCQGFPSASQNLQHHGPGKAYPKQKSQDVETGDPGEGISHGNDLVLFMPFLNWDMEHLRSMRETIVGAAPDNHDKTAKEELNDEQKLLKAYLTNSHPLHIRRTLDQYYYHTLEDTSRRDGDQVVSRYQESFRLRPKILTMVDQLWLWVLSGVGSQPDTVISCFPHVGEIEGVPHPDADGLTSVLRRIKLSFLDMSFHVKTVYDLAGLIAATCSRIYLDPGSTLSFRGGQIMLQFAELYETEISNITQEEAVLFDSFAKLGEGDVADVSAEIKLLSRIKDVLDELNIMRILFGHQRKVLKTMDDIVKTVAEFEEDSEYDTDNESPLRSDGDDPAENHNGTRDADGDPEPDGGRDATGTEVEGALEFTKQMRRIWGDRSDPDESSFPLAVVTTSLEEINAMIERAEKTERALTSIVDLKQKHNSVTDARESLKQGRTVLIFTLTTIIFLPLSFLASFLALNISQFQRDSDGQLDLGYVSYIMFPVSSVVSAILIWVAFNVDHARRCWQWVTEKMMKALVPETKRQNAEPGVLPWAGGFQSDEARDLEALKLDSPSLRV